MNNQATAPIITINNNTLTFFSTITTTAISSASDIVNINPALAISVAATEQDLNFETRLNTMENTIFKLGSTFEKSISANISSGKSRGQNDSEYLTDFSVNAPTLKLISLLMIRVIVTLLSIEIKQNIKGSI